MVQLPLLQSALPVIRCLGTNDLSLRAAVSCGVVYMHPHMVVV